jgi:hypothetical protein
LYSEEEGIPTHTRLDILKAYGHYADQQEILWDPTKIRRFLIKAITTLFTGEPNAKRYRIALDEIVKLAKQRSSSSSGSSSGGGILTTMVEERQPHVPLSELILNAASTHLSEEVLLRTPQESYECKLYQDNQQNHNTNTIVMVAESNNQSSTKTTTTATTTNHDSQSTTRSNAVSEWQSDRRQEQEQQQQQITS